LSRGVSGTRSTILFGGVGFNTLILFSEEYAVEHTAMRRIINIAEHIFLVNLNLLFKGCQFVDKNSLFRSRVYGDRTFVSIRKNRGVQPNRGVRK
jgi:hypothetical protein